MSLLSGIGNWIRKEADNVGSFVTGQPAHGQQPAQPNQPNQPQQIQSRPPQANNAPQLIIKQGSNSNIPINRAQNPQNISVNNSAPPPINIRTNSLQAPNPLMQKQKLTMGSLKVNAQPNAQQINVPRPQPGGIHSWNTPTSQPNLAHSIMSAPGKLLNADKAIVNTGVNMGKGLEQGASGLVKTAIIAPAVETMAGFSHNPYVKQAAEQYGDQSRAQAAGFIQGAITRPAAELAGTVKHPFNQFSYHPNSLVEQAVFGNRPVQNVAANVASNYDAHKNLNPAVRLGVAGADLAGQVLNILPTAAGATKLAKVTGAKAILAGRPAKLADSDVAALANYRRQAGTGQMMTDETYNRGIAAARKAGLKHTDFKGIDNLLGQYRTYYTKVAQRKDALNNIPIGLSTKDVSPKPNVPEVQPIKITPPPKIKISGGETASEATLPKTNLQSRPLAIRPQLAETEKPGMLEQSSLPPNKRIELITNASEPNIPETGSNINRTELTGRQLSTPNTDLLTPEAYANTFGLTKMQAEKDFAEMASGASKVKHMSAEELAKLGPEEKLTVRQKRELIQREPRQQTINQPELNPEEGSIKSAIANATALADERDARLAEAQRLGSKLDDHDKELMYRYDAGEKIDDLAKEAHNQEMFSKAAHTAADALDYSLAAGRAGGAATLRQHNYIPHNYEVSEEWLDKNKIPEDQRIKIGKEVKGFRDTHAKYGSYAQAASKGLKPLFKNPFEDIADYTKGGSIKTRNNLLQASLAKAMPDDIAPIDTVSMNGQRFRPAAGGNLPFAASEKLDKQLQGFKQAWTPTSRAGKVAEGAIRLTGKGTKKSLFALSYFHQAHIAENVNMAAILGREPGVIARGIIDEVRATGGISKSSYYRLMDRAREDGTTEYARKMGIIYHPNSQLGRFVDVYANELAKVAKEGGIPEGSQEAVDLGTIYNRLLGRDNSLVEARNPTIEKFTSYFALAPHYLRSQLRLVADAFLPKKLGGAGYDKVFKLTSPGGAARSAVLGPRVFGALLAITASAIIMQHFPSWQDAKREAGLQGNNVNPNIKIKSKNAKGEGQVMNLPTDPIGLALGFVTDPQHFFQSRYSPVLSFATKEITNKNWNGQPLSDPNQPNSIIIRTKNAALNSVTPIGIQNFTNLQGNQNNPNIEQGALQEIGFRLKTDPNDPQVQANKAYFDGLKQVTNDLKTKNGQFGQYWAQQFSNLHPSNTTDASGAKYPTPYNPVSSEQKYAAYAAVDANGHQVLSPVFYADQKLANMTPGYPSSPIYKLQGNGTDVTGAQAPKSLVALQYQHAQDPAAKLNIMNANGGQNGWLSQYEGQVADYSKNYQSNLTNYFKGLGWTPQAINNYWSKHPSTPDPIDTLNFDKPTTDLINRYYQLSASGDSTAASTFFSQHADVLGPAFDQTAQHSNALRAAKGELQLQGYPAESAHVQQVLDSMPQGSDSASKKARALAITGNPDVNQYLADVALYEALAKGAQFRYKNPANMSATEGQNINNSGQAGQTFLKDTVSLGNYDIGKNALGQYDFMGAGGNTGGFGNGYSAGGGSGGYKSSSKKIPFFPKKRVTKVRPHYAKKAHKVFLNKGNPLKIASGGAGKHSAVKIKSGGKSIKIAKAKAPTKTASKTGVTFV